MEINGVAGIRGSPVFYSIKGDLSGYTGAVKTGCGVWECFQTVGVDCLPATFAQAINALFDAADCRFDLGEESFKVPFQCKVLGDLFDFETVIANVIAGRRALLGEICMECNLMLKPLHFGE